MKWLGILVLSFVAIAGHAKSNKESELCAQVRQHAQAGDLIFLSIDSFLFHQVALATSTWTSHVGVVLPDSKGNSLLVYESKVPFSTATPLCDYIARTADNKVAVMRPLQPLQPEELEKLVAEANARLNVPYHTGFDYDSSWRTFCSKFVYDLFQKIGREVGQLETFADLIEKNPEGNIEFWKKWFMGEIPLQRRTVTPVSQLVDDDFTPVFTSNVQL